MKIYLLYFFLRTIFTFHSIAFPGSPKSELQDICLVSETEPPQVPEDHHSNPTNSRRGSIDTDASRPSLDMRRCSLDQTFTGLNPGIQPDSLAGRRASIDNGLMIRSTLEPTFVEDPVYTTEMLPLDAECSFASVVTSAPVASMSIAPVESTHVTYSQQLASGVQSLPPSGPPSVQADPRHNSMPSSPLGSHAVTSVPLTSGPLDSSTLTSGSLTSVPLTSGPLTSVPLISVTLTSGPLSEVPLTSVPLTTGLLTSGPLTTEPPIVAPVDQEPDPQPPPPPAASQNQNSSNFLISELESVLGTGGAFSFASPSPEKMLQSIPPSSMMIKTDDEKAKKGQRTDFLGAFKESTNASTSDGVVDAKDVSKDDTLAATFDDGQSNSLIRSTLADVTHPVSFSNTALSGEPVKSVTDERDSLSQLFEEMTDAQANQSQGQETK